MCTDTGESSMSRLRRSVMSLSSFCNREIIFNVSLGEETCSLDPKYDLSSIFVHPCSLPIIWKVFVLPFELTALRGQSRTEKLFLRIVASPMGLLFCLLIIRFNCAGALSGFFSAWINALMALAPGRRPVIKHPVWAHKKAYSCSHAAFPFPT